MDSKQIMEVFQDTAYVRTGGSSEELKCANYLVGKCAGIGLRANLESFEVEMASIETARLVVDGEDIPCKGYLCAGSGSAEKVV